MRSSVRNTDTARSGRLSAETTPTTVYVAAMPPWASARESPTACPAPETTTTSSSAAGSRPSAGVKPVSAVADQGCASTTAGAVPPGTDRGTVTSATTASTPGSAAISRAASAGTGARSRSGTGRSSGTSTCCTAPTTTSAAV